MLEKVLADFGRTCGLPKLKLDENDSCSLVFDEQYEVTYTRDPEDRSVILSSPIFTATTSRAPMLRHALETSYLGARTRGGTISIDPERNIYVYWKRHDERALESAEDLGDATDRFLMELIRIRQVGNELLHNDAMSREAPANEPAEQGGRNAAAPGSRELPPDAWLLYV